MPQPDPVQSLRLDCIGGEFNFSAAKPDEKGVEQKRFDGVGYSGGVVSDRWMWVDGKEYQRFIVDLSTTKVEETHTGKIFALLDHMSSKRVGVSKVDIKDKVHVSGEFFHQNENAENIYNESKQDAPWRFSIGFEYQTVTAVGKNADPIKVNGIDFNDGVIISNATIKHIAFTIDPADRDTFAETYHKQNQNLGENMPKPNATIQPQQKTEQPATDNSIELSAENERLKQELEKANADKQAMENDKKKMELTALADKFDIKLEGNITDCLMSFSSHQLKVVDSLMSQLQQQKSVQLGAQHLSNYEQPPAGVQQPAQTNVLLSAAKAQRGDA